MYLLFTNPEHIMSSNVVDIAPFITAGFGVSGLKTWKGREGRGFQFTLTFGKKRVAQISDDAFGGEVSVEWKGVYPNGTPRPGTTKPTLKAVTEARAALTMLIEKGDDLTFGDGHTLSLDEGLVLEELINHFEMVKLCKKETMFRTAEGEEFTVRERYNPGVKAWILKNHPGAIIHNERLAS